MGSKEGHIYTIEEGGAEMGNREPSEFFPTKKKKFLTCYVSQLFEYRFINILPKEGGDEMKLDIFTKLERGPANILRSVDGGWRLIIAASNLQQSRQLWYATMGENPTITTVGGKRRRTNGAYYHQTEVIRG